MSLRHEKSEASGLGDKLSNQCAALPSKPLVHKFVINAGSACKRSAEKAVAHHLLASIKTDCDKVLRLYGMADQSRVMRNTSVLDIPDTVKLDCNCQKINGVQLLIYESRRRQRLDAQCLVDTEYETMAATIRPNIACSWLANCTASRYVVSHCPLNRSLFGIWANQY